MGCCGSSGSTDTPLNNTANSSSVPKANTQGGKNTENKVELAFKTKRANIFTEGVDLGRNAFVQKRIKKTEKQKKTICKSLRIPLFLRQ